ncbi:hypothetical protein [Actinomadura sp. NTSP31]|uniref:hypothetical protein n=1 Tax=Actinomadura sp. NTSP31 TaxID=1735447 RepID=UPI0035C1D9BC
MSTRRPGSDGGTASATATIVAREEGPGRSRARPGIPHITANLEKAKPGDILLCHDGGGDRSQTVAALRTVIPALNLTFVVL